MWVLICFSSVEELPSFIFSNCKTSPNFSKLPPCCGEIWRVSLTLILTLIFLPVTVSVKVTGRS